jgi:glucan biosynthesis protein C
MRRYDLDWLRVLVFGLLIFYHVGMFFVADWEYHIKNNITYEWIKYPMLLLNQWRLPILFVISGMGTSYALAKRTGLQFAYERTKKLLIPLLFGMLVIVPPQVYVQRLTEGTLTMGYLEFWRTLAFSGIYPVGNLTWNHLWFLPYLLIFSLMLIPVFIYLRSHPGNFVFRKVKRLCTSRLGLYFFVIPSFFLEAFVEPFFNATHALVNDWFVLSSGITFFFIGFLLISVKEVFWAAVEKHRKTYLTIAITGFAIFLFLTEVFADGYVRHFTEAMVTVITMWSWIFCIFGYGARYLNTPGKLLSYCNEAVYPFYIMHQTVTLLLGYYVMDKDWAFLPKFLFMSFGTFTISWLIYEFVIRRNFLIRPLFGLTNKKHLAAVTKATYI